MYVQDRLCMYVCTVCTIYIYIYIDYLLTKCEVCTGKYLPEVFVQTEPRRSGVCAEHSKGKYLPMQTKQTRLIRNLLYGFWLLFSSLLTKLCVCELAA